MIDVILPLAISDVYVYNIPDNYVTLPPTGARVLVPLGTKEMVGIVLQEHSGSISANINVRDIISVLDTSPIVSRQQLKLWQWIAEYYMCTMGEVMAAALPKKINDKLYDSNRKHTHLYEYKQATEPPVELNSQQQEAINTIHKEWKQKDVVLLHGVTSSGKTEVYIHLILEQLAKGKQVLYMVPEIALTTQLTNRLQRIFGNSLCVYHSRINDTKRIEIYHQLTLPDTEYRVILGARSSIFLPLQNVGLIIIDEEHEPSYKQQEPAPRYHARSTAIMLAQQIQAKVLLGTATPSVETYYNTINGKFGLAAMPIRYNKIQMPKITLVDLRQQYSHKEMCGHLSMPLIHRIKNELERKKQIILFINRRGYAPVLLCRQCGTPPKCPNCDIPLTLHLHDKELRCHYCGHIETMYGICKACDGTLVANGLGTERLENEIESLFPEAKVLRMDFDSTRKKNDYQNIIDTFSRHEVDILIGTQMVTKGLHFDNVSLVAVLDADQLLNQPNFRNYERAYQMLEQVAGRAGRKEEQGEVIIQTWNTKNDIYKYIKEHDYNQLYLAQIPERKEYHYPPFYRLINIILKHTNPQRLQMAAEILHYNLIQIFGKRTSNTLTPAIPRINKMHILQINLKIENKANIIRAKKLITMQLSAILHNDNCKGIKIICDVDPM